MYLIHFNGNHSSRNGQFVSGDGDKDGVIDDHHNYARNKVSEQEVDGEVNANTLATICTTGRRLAGFAFSKTKIGKPYAAAIKELKKTVEWDKMMKETNWNNYKKEKSQNFYQKAADFINDHM